MTPPTQFDTEFGMVVEKASKTNRAGQLSNLVGGVMTPPYRRGYSSSASFFSSLGSTKGLQTTSQRLMGVPRAWNFSS